MKSWLRRWAMRYFDLVDGCSHRAMRTQSDQANMELYRRNYDLHQAYYRIDELNQILDGYRKDAWRPALKDALKNINQEENHGRNTNHNGRT